MKYLSVHDGWLKENFFSLTRTELCKRFNEEFNLDVSPKGLEQHCNSALSLKKGTHHFYSEEEIRWIKANLQGHTWYEITDLFNERFDTNAYWASLKSYCVKHGIKHSDATPGVKFTREQESWLRDNTAGRTWPEIMKAFNKRFGAHKTLVALKSKANRRMNVYSNGRCGAHTGNIPHNLQPDGAKAVRTSGYHYVKYNGKWMPKQLMVYEMHYGKLPENMFVVFLDGNPTNYDLDNLYPVDRRIHATMCLNGWYSTSPELTLTALKWCELYYAVRRVVKQ